MVLKCGVCRIVLPFGGRELLFGQGDVFCDKCFGSLVSVSRCMVCGDEFFVTRGKRVEFCRSSSCQNSFNYWSRRGFVNERGVRVFGLDD